MSDYLQFFVGPGFSAFAGGASIVSLLWAIVSWRKSRGRRVYHGVWSQQLLNIAALGGRKALVTIGEVQGLTVRRDVHLIANKTGETLSSSDFLTGLVLSLRDDASVFYLNVYNGAGLSDALAKKIKDGFKIDDFLLGDGDGILFEIVYSSSGQTDLAGTTKKQKSLKTYNPVHYIANWIVPGVLLLALPLVMALVWAVGEFPQLPKILPFLGFALPLLVWTPVGQSLVNSFHLPAERRFQSIVNNKFD
ncbi:hypothetical protein [uncultured Roseobacter sp.]|uniref:hypothetical protein n=1 Tax=uncultured Roseobacter sp. TaxID=114847 RepID=UPI00262D45A5|nr:hypothetical protein [uncultured Roseobacter sp.]